MKKNNIRFSELWRICVVPIFPLDFPFVFTVSIVMIRLRYIIIESCQSFQTVLFSGLRNISLQIRRIVGRVWNEDSRMLCQRLPSPSLLQSVWSYKISPLWGCLHWSGVLLFGECWTSFVASVYQTMKPSNGQYYRPKSSYELYSAILLSVLTSSTT